MEREILHCDCNNFYASVELLRHPELKRVPMAVCGDPEKRHGIILSKNEPAKACGVKTAETVWQARFKCPRLVLLRAHYEEYARYSRRIFELYGQYTDQVEPFGLDEAWLDVTGSRRLFGSGYEIAEEIRNRVRRETGLTISVGVSFNKVFAKLGSDYKKPDATTLFSEENYRELVFPLPVDALLFVGHSATRTLAALGIRTIGDLAAADPEMLRRRLGKMGDQMIRYANGQDTAPVRRFTDRRERQSAGCGATFHRDILTREDAVTAIRMLADHVAVRLRRYRLKGCTVRLGIRDQNFRNIGRQKPLPIPTLLAGELAESAVELLDAAWNRRPIRALTLTACHLIPEQEGDQMSLLFPAEEREKRERLEREIDGLREKYGEQAVTTAAIRYSDLKVR